MMNIFIQNQNNADMQEDAHSFNLYEASFCILSPIYTDRLEYCFSSNNDTS